MEVKYAPLKVMGLSERIGAAVHNLRGYAPTNL